MHKPLKMYDIAGEEENVAILSKDKQTVIFTDNEAVHTIHGIDDPVLGDGTTTRQILLTKSVKVKDLGQWVRTFGARIENNYAMLLHSIKELGLDPEDYPRFKHCYEKVLL